MLKIIKMFPTSPSFPNLFDSETMCKEIIVDVDNQQF